MNASRVTSVRTGEHVKDLLENALALSRRRAARPVPFIENKCPNLHELHEILQLSADSGYWTNFGPVCTLLESALEHHLQLPSSRAAVMCSSGTAALLTLIALKEYRAGRKLRWVVSAYGFRSTQLGPLADAAVLDCDEGAMLDVHALARLDAGAWDGLVLTNTFGLRSQVREYVDLCARLGKELIVDNAGLLAGFERGHEHAAADEILSFHQTKPWGMGEGGCAILSRRDAAVFRDLINTGENLPAPARAGASNSKISDFSCALILQRLRREEEWAPAYREQARRILALAQEAGLQPLAPLDLDAQTPPHLPLLAASPLPEAGLANPHCVIRKYYLPLTAAPTASALYARIVNVPCHPGMAALGDHEIRLALPRP